MTKFFINDTTKVYKKSLLDNFFKEKMGLEALRIAYFSVKEGIEKARKYIHNHPYEFINLGHKATTINTKILAEFRESYEKDYILNQEIKTIYTNRMIYFLINRKVLICFKAINENSIVKNMMTGRHSAIMRGEDVTFNKRVREELHKLGVDLSLPLYYIGYNISDTGSIKTYCLRYSENQIAFSLNLSELFAPKEIDYEVNYKGVEFNNDNKKEVVI